MERSRVSLAQILVAGPAGPIGAADPDIYDPSILRTIALDFPTDGFFSQIDTVSRTTADGYVTADLTFLTDADARLNGVLDHVVCGASSTTCSSAVPLCRRRSRRAAWIRPSMLSAAWRPRRARARESP